MVFTMRQALMKVTSYLSAIRAVKSNDTLAVKPDEAFKKISVFGFVMYTLDNPLISPSSKQSNDILTVFLSAILTKFYNNKMMLYLIILYNAFNSIERIS